MDITSHIEYDFTGSTSLLTEVTEMCHIVRTYQLPAVSVPPMLVKTIKSQLAGTTCSVCAVIGFPLGFHAIEAKLAEAVLAIVDGADELSVVVNLIAVKNQDWQYLAKEINSLLPVIRKSNKRIGVIIEAGSLSDEEIVTCCDLYGAAAIDFMQLSTGFALPLPQIEKAVLLRKHLADAIMIKAHADGETPGLALLQAGVSRVLSARPLSIL